MKVLFFAVCSSGTFMSTWLALGNSDGLDKLLLLFAVPTESSMAKERPRSLSTSALRAVALAVGAVIRVIGTQHTKRTPSKLQS